MFVEAVVTITEKFETSKLRLITEAMEKFRIKDIGTLEIRLINDRIQFTTTPGYQEVKAELSKENAIKIANKLCEWANAETSGNSLHKHIVSQQRELLFAFFMWFRENGEKYMNESIEQMIQIYLKSKL